VARELPRNEDLSVVRSQSPVLWALTAGPGGFALPYALLWPLAAAGAVVLWRQGRAKEQGARAALPVAGAAVMLAAPCLVFFVTGRYRAPLAPVLCVLAALGLQGLDAVDFEAELHYAVSGRQARLGDDAAAVEAWRRAVARRPDYLEAGYNLGLALERLGRTGEAVRTYEALLRWYPREALLRERLARLQGSARGGGP
jgi:tetratricopeptide (TPR) repeat protein